MRVPVVIRLLGLFLFLFTLTLIPPAVISVAYGDGELMTFMSSGVVLAISGVLLWYPFRGTKEELRPREAFVVVSLFWVVLGLLASLPFVLGAHLSVTDAAFEAVSGFTTTGATAIIGLDELPPSILIYRQQLQWYGGLGVIVLAVAILPMLGVGGMQLYRAETPGPMKEDKLTPRIAHTARALWRIYLGLTIVCAAAYYLAGMSLFDAVAHSLTTISTGGFSTHDASIGFFDSPMVELIAVIFMLLGAISFSVHFIVLSSRNPVAYGRDTQTAVFVGVVIVLTMIVTLTLYLLGFEKESFRYALFEVVSVITSTGYGTADFSAWPLFLPVLLIFASFMGGCAGSTAGGIKVVRFVILAKEGSREILRLIHPRIVQPIRLGGTVLPERVVDAVWGFFSMYVAVFAVLMIAVMATGVDQVTAFGAVATSLNNLGPGLGNVGTTFANINDGAKWLCTFAMLLGRLEIFTLLGLLSPAFWRK